MIIEAKVEPMPSELAGGDYERDDAFRLLVQEWITERWNDKDARISALLDADDAGTGAPADPVRRSA